MVTVGREGGGGFGGVGLDSSGGVSSGSREVAQIDDGWMRGGG